MRHSSANLGRDIEWICSRKPSSSIELALLDAVLMTYHELGDSVGLGEIDFICLFGISS